MKLDAKACYQALLTHDTRFDGMFFVGVASTGIYCRTVCTARTPRPGNCSFYGTAAAAERAGYRPCLRCRPELAPGTARVDAVDRLAAIAAGRIEDGALAEGGLDALAAELGVSARHLRRVVERAFGVTPVELAQTSRLLLAKRLLTDTDLPITEIAFASGFASLRRFNALFRERYRLNPTGLRKARTATSEQQTLTCELAYIAPFDWNALLSFLQGRIGQGVEAVEGGRYLRTLAVGEARGWLSVAPTAGRDSLTVEVSLGLAAALRPILATIKRVFDLGASSDHIAAHLGVLAADRPGLRVPGAFGGFEMGARAILGQQVSVAAASTLSGRFHRRFGDPAQTPHVALTHLAASTSRVASADPAELVALGILRSRAVSIVALARALEEGRLVLAAGSDPEVTMAQLRELPGVGEWTAQYIAMRALGWPDAFPHTDLGIRKALGSVSPRRVLEMAEAWRPWRAYAAMHLWKSLEIPG